MTRLRRRPRTVYRVYDEDEYLAGADAYPDWDAAPAHETKCGRSLQRLAGAAALTGAVGTVGGVVGLAGLHAHSGDRGEIAERSVPSMRTAASRRSASIAHAVSPHVAHRSRPRHRSANRRPVEVAFVSRRIETRSAAEIPARTVAVSTPQDTPAPAPMAGATTDDAPVAAAAGPRAQSEFGFER
jgi:hypothetical protein